MFLLFFKHIWISLNKKCIKVFYFLNELSYIFGEPHVKLKMPEISNTITISTNLHVNNNLFRLNISV